MSFNNYIRNICILSTHYNIYIYYIINKTAYTLSLITQKIFTFYKYYSILPLLLLYYSTFILFITLISFYLFYKYYFYQGLKI